MRGKTVAARFKHIGITAAKYFGGLRSYDGIDVDQAKAHSALGGGVCSARPRVRNWTMGFCESPTPPLGRSAFKLVPPVGCARGRPAGFDR